MIERQLVDEVALTLTTGAKRRWQTDQRAPTTAGLFLGPHFPNESDAHLHMVGFYFANAFMTAAWPVVLLFNSVGSP